MKGFGSVPRIRDYMSLRPRVVDPDTSIIEAFSIMRDGGFHHLPVVEGGELVGIVSDREVLEAWTTLPPEVPTVKQVMNCSPLSVDLDATLEEVARLMVGQRIHCVVVQEGDGRVSGVFTANDAMLTLASLLQASRKETRYLAPDAGSPKVGMKLPTSAT